MLGTVDIEERRLNVGHLSDFGTSVLTHDDARATFAMWRELKGERTAPFRAELDAGRIGARAPFLAILEHVNGGNFRVRIAGDRLNRWFGMELRGMSALSLLSAEARNHLQAALNRVVGDPAVAAVAGRARRADGVTAGFELALLPMRSDFGRIDRVLVGLWLTDAPAGAAGPFRFEAERFSVAPIAEEPTEDAATTTVEAPAAAFEPQPFRAIEGGGETGGARRRDHLRLVKKP
jgi:hypothetical protein